MSANGECSGGSQLRMDTANAFDTGVSAVSRGFAAGAGTSFALLCALVSNGASGHGGGSVRGGGRGGGVHSRHGVLGDSSGS